MSIKCGIIKVVIGKINPNYVLMMLKLFRLYNDNIKGIQIKLKYNISSDYAVNIIIDGGIFDD